MTEQTHMPAQLAYFESPSHPLHSASGGSPMSLAERKRIEERKTQEVLIVEEAVRFREELNRFLRDLPHTLFGGLRAPWVPYCRF